MPRYDPSLLNSSKIILQVPLLPLLQTFLATHVYKFHEKLLHVVSGEHQVETKGLDTGEDVVFVEWHPILSPFTIVEEILCAARATTAAAKQACTAGAAPVAEVPLEFSYRGDPGTCVLLELFRGRITRRLPGGIGHIGDGAVCGCVRDHTWEDTSHEGVLLRIDVQKALFATSQDLR
jgi:hypothetical protein